MKSFELDSSIIPVQKDLYPLLFLNWINNEDNIIYKTRNFLQYEFKLILRGSRDGFDDINTGKIGRVIEKQCAIRCIQKWGPLFGKINNYSNDIMMTPNGEWSSSPNSYPDINIPRNFKIDDYEVFQILKRKF
ncbi:uncharacterized protein OCT59_012529 [Rhizophagus irregularis]|uniref:uncharacterized protein n=1 Tax=Rhizophagus irregularis TaxID=588596 RepID=UPI003320F9D8|nr:hypothetical protein OCT59_012529 [Rhizophagus irregularis]